MKGIVFLLLLFCLLPITLTANAGPPIERVPLSNITISGMDESLILKSNEQTTIRTEYGINYPNTEYVIIFQITNEKEQVVSLSWIEGSQQKLTEQPGTYICDDELCFDEWALPEPYVCGDKICQGDPLGSKFAETSWLPLESGNYDVVIFAWESLDNPTALSPPLWTQVTVED